MVEVVIPADQGCCGASHHQGQMAQTRTSPAIWCAASRQPKGSTLLVAAWLRPSTKAYGELLGDKGDGFACPVLDVHEFLAARGLSETFSSALQPLPVTVAYHDACHMIHGQGISNEPRMLLKMIPELQLREATEAGVCCGSAGIYNLVQPEEAAELGQLKVEDSPHRRQRDRQR